MDHSRVKGSTEGAVGAAGAADAHGRPSFERFVREHTATVLRFCLGRLRDAHAAEDAAQETMLRLHRQLRSGPAPAEPLSWVLAMARNCCQEVERTRRRHRADELDEGALPAERPPEVGAEVDVEAALEQLGDSERAIVHMKHTEGLRCRQIAERLGRPIGTVTAALARAYAKLRPRLLTEMER